MDIDMDSEVTTVPQEDTLETLETQIALREQTALSLQEQSDALSSLSHGEAVEPLVALQLAELKTHLHATALVKARRNGLLPISRIPPEVLGYIFLLATRGDMHSSNAKPGINLSQVCRVWWHVIHGTPSLWTDIRVYSSWRYSIKAIEQFLTLSKQLPLLIDLSNHGAPPPIRALGLIIHHMWRARSLKMSFKTSAYEELGANLPGLPPTAPFLRSLVLTRFYDRDDDWGAPIPEGPDSVKFPAFLQWSTPCLLELELRGYRIDWSAPMFKSSLSRLSVICNDHDQVTPKHTVSLIIQVIQGLPQLEHLLLERTIYESSDTAMPKVHFRTELPRLIELRIKEAAVPTVCFLDHFIVAPFAKQQISLTDGVAPDLIPSLIRVLSAILRTGMPLGTKSLEAVFLDKYFCGFSKVKPSTPRDTTLSHLLLRFPHNFADAQDAFSVNLCSQLFIGDAHLLKLVDEKLLLDYGDPAPWDRLLDKLRNVERLHLEHNRKPHTVGFIDLLLSQIPGPPSDSDSEASDATPPVFAFPKLKKIRFKYVKIGRSPHQLRRRPEMLGKPSPFVRALRVALVLRKEAGLGMPDLTIKRCSYVREEDLVHLREVASVKLVEDDYHISRPWDENNQESEDETDEENDE